MSEWFSHQTSEPIYFETYIFLIFSSNDVFQQQQKAGSDSVMANIGKRFYHGWLLTDPV